MASNFTSTLLQVAVDEFRANKITRLQLFSLRIGLRLFPDLEEQLMEQCCSHLIAEGVVNEGSNPKAIDWAGLTAFLKEILPYLIQILPLFFQKQGFKAPS